MKQKLSSGAQKVAAAAKARPAETRWSLIAAVAGAVLGFMIGGVGIAAMGGAGWCAGSDHLRIGRCHRRQPLWRRQGPTSQMRQRLAAILGIGSILATSGAAHAIDVPPNARLDYTGRSWVCDRGYHRSGNGCLPLKIPANGQLDYTGNGWTCSPGYRQQGQTCAVVVIPQNAQLDYTGHGWTCNTGYRQQGQNCVIVQIPKNARLDYTGHGWTCDPGFARRGQECVNVKLPENAELDYTGHNWKCKYGFRRAGNACEMFQVPQNARIDYTGNNFQCNLNFKRVGEQCQAMTQQEIQYQNYLILLARQCGGSKSVEVEGTCGSESVSGEIDVCQGSKEASGELEFDSGLTTQFDGRWTSAREFEGSDSFGNSCDLEID